MRGSMSFLVGSDIGGTFTDVVGFDAAAGSLIFGKKLTNRQDLVEGVISCLNNIGITSDAVSLLKHGTTQVINLLLERAGSNTVLVTTAGFGDILEINRAGRPVSFRLDYSRNPPLVPRSNCFEIDERLDAEGAVVRPLTRGALTELADRIAAVNPDAIAVSLLNSYVNPAHEQEIAEFLRSHFPDTYVTAGTDISKEWFEYERAATAVANAYVGPRAVDYIDRFDRRLEKEGFPGLFYIVGSNGGMLRARRAKQQPIALVESGPIGGCVGATIFARELGRNGIVAFDMGGTTAKCALVEQYRFDVQHTYYVGGYDYGFPVRTPVLDIVEVGTGGGSIAHIDDLGRLLVGPRSAGSLPGPICFGLGGVEPTVTDANLTLGRIGGDTFLSGALSLDADASRKALAEKIGSRLGYVGAGAADQVAAGIVNLANVQMASAIKEVTIERGHDVRDFDLFVFGGGGPLHGVDLARELNMARVIVPPEPGNFSALGMLFVEARVEEFKTVLLDLADDCVADMERELSEQREIIRETLRQDFDSETLLFEEQAEIRFKGQRHSMRVDINGTVDAAVLRQRFLDAYRKRYGHANAENPAEVIGLRVVGVSASEAPDIARLHCAGRNPDSGPKEMRSVHFASVGVRLDTPVYRRDALPLGWEMRGPAVIEEYGSTTVIGPDDRLFVGPLGELQILLR